MKRSKLATERRKWPRLPLAIPVFVGSTNPNGNQSLEFASVVNISAGGALIALSRSLPLSATVFLEIPSAPPASVASITANSRTIRAEAIRAVRADNYHLIGFKFSTPLRMDSRQGTPMRRKATSSK
ncbi:MAG: PilZ domain-containing protein [Terriglobales bacterium]